MEQRTWGKTDGGIEISKRAMNLAFWPSLLQSESWLVTTPSP